MQKRIFRTWTLVLALVPMLMIAQDAPAPEVGDTRHKLTVKADEYFEFMEYTTALEVYAKAYSKEKDRDHKVRIAYNMAECYRFTGQFKRASSYYQRADKLGYGPLAKLGYAEMLQSLGEYEDAIVAYEDYKKAVPSDPRGEEGIAACRQAAEWRQVGSLFALDNAKDLNSKKSDYAATYLPTRKNDVTIFISTMRDDVTGKKEDGWTGQRFSDIFVIEGQEKKARGRRGQEANANDEMVWGDLEALSDVINTRDHEGVVTFDSRGKTMYFTRCMKVKNVQMGCAIYMSKKVGLDWANPEPVVIAVDSGASVGHPALSPDDNLLYFAGDIPGGKGGRDIYVTEYDRRAREWKKPTSLNINTPGDELYPYVHNDGYLYFSSNGHPGMGGFDSYRVKLDENGMPVGDVENMMSPINSEADDIALRWVPGSGNTERGFIISNRKGTRGEHDIWYVTEWKKEFEVDGIVVSSKTGKPVADATVEVSNKNGETFTVTTDSNGKFRIERGQLAEGMTYKLNLSRKKYLNAIGDISTQGLVLSDYSPVPEERTYVRGFEMKLTMDPIEVPIVLPNVFFDLAKSELREESKVALDTVFNILRRNPNITIELRSHTDYRDTDARNDALSQARAQSCVDYLIEKGIASDRLTAVGMGEKDPFVIPDGYAGLGAEEFKAGDRLTEAFIKRLSAANQEVANQINRRTDFRVLSDDYVPSTPVETTEGEEGLAGPETGEKPLGQTIELGPSDRSLGKIAADNGMNIVQLKQLNGGLRGARPMPGMIMKITWGGDYTEFDATHYQIQRGDTLSSIAKATGVSVKDLRDMNGVKRDSDLIVGSYLQIQ